MTAMTEIPASSLAFTPGQGVQFEGRNGLGPTPGVVGFVLRQGERFSKFSAGWDGVAECDMFEVRFHLRDAQTLKMLPMTSSSLHRAEELTPLDVRPCRCC